VHGKRLYWGMFKERINICKGNLLVRDRPINDMKFGFAVDVTNYLALLSLCNYIITVILKDSLWYKADSATYLALKI
jgi:hypothetical protein